MKSLISIAIPILLVPLFLLGAFLGLASFGVPLVLVLNLVTELVLYVLKDPVVNLHWYGYALAGLDGLALLVQPIFALMILPIVLSLWYDLSFSG